MSTVKDFSIKNYYTRDLPLDEGMDGENAATIPLRIRRFSVAQLQAFQRGFERLIHPTAQRFIYRTGEGDEQAKTPDGKQFVLGDDEIQRRREADMTPEVAAQYAAAKEADDLHMTTFCSAAITEHAWLPKGYRLRVEQDDESTIEIDGGPQSGAGLVAAFGGNLSFLLRITKAIHFENTLAPEAKKALRSLSALTPSSPRLEGDGTTPAATALDAEPAGTAPSGDVSADPDQIQSGSIQGAA